MKHILFAAAFLLAPSPLIAAQPPGQDALAAQVAADTVDHYIRPGFDRLAAEADLMSTDMDALCAAPGQGELDTAQGEFHSLVRAFSRIEAVSIGPMATDNRRARLLFWPDVHGVMVTQVQKIIDGKDKAAEDPAKLKDMSAAVQGLPALEYVLFSSGAADMTKIDIAADRCAYGQAISERIADTAASFNNDWQSEQGTGAHLINPKPDYADYRNRTETVHALVDIITHGFKTIHDTRLLPVLGTSPATDKPKSALWWRSGTTLDAIAANIEGLSQMISVAGLDRAVPADQRTVVAKLQATLQNATRTLEDIGNVPVANALADKTRREDLRTLFADLKTLENLSGNDLAKALGVSAGL